MSSDPKQQIVYNGTEFILASSWGNDWSKDWESWDNSWTDFEKDIDSKYKKCKHEWKSTQLIITTVYDCVKCGAKKEDEEK
jgi:hypothetical protein